MLRPVVVLLFCLITAGALCGCRRPALPLPEPDSVESLCRSAVAQPKLFKLPGIESLRNDRLVKGQTPHVDLDAVEDAVVESVQPTNPVVVSEDNMRRALVEAGGGVIVHWRKPVTLHLSAAELKARAATAAIFGAGITDSSDSNEQRELYLLVRLAGDTSPLWRRFVTTDHSRVCS
jgi:hypothetical protein